MKLCQKDTEVNLKRLIDPKKGDNLSISKVIITVGLNTLKYF